MYKVNKRMYKAGLLKVHKGLNRELEKTGLEPPISDQMFTGLNMQEQIIIINYRGAIDIKATVDDCLENYIGRLNKDGQAALRKEISPDKSLLNLMGLMLMSFASGTFNEGKAIIYGGYSAVPFNEIIILFRVKSLHIQS